MTSKIVEANIAVHSAMASSYNANEPHFRPENRQKVRAKLERLRAATGPALLDVGCGTGFIIDLARDLFGEIHGVDITQAMLDRVDASGGHVTVHRAVAEAMPFPDSRFDAVSAYAFLHHLEDYRLVLKEMHRVLKQGGQAYIDLEPNRLFWQAIVETDAMEPDDKRNLSDIVAREISSVLHTDDRVYKEFGIAPETFNDAEYTKSILGGIDPFEFPRHAREAGFRSCEVVLEWFLGQGSVMHQQSFEEASRIEAYLRSAAPVSARLFKYLAFNLVK